MATDDRCCTIIPYYTVHPGKMDAVKAMCEEFVEMTENEPACLYFGFSFDGDQVHCREGYTDADGALAHVVNVMPKLQEFLKIADLVRFEIHGPAQELDKLRVPLAEFKPRFFTLEYGFRR
jgi:quinol monooxygenase YgiN